MALRSDSVAGVRFLAAVHEGRGIKPAARSVGVHSWTGYRWLREAFLALRSNGLDAEAALADLGFFTAKAQVWEEEFLASLGDGRHHLRVRVEVEDIFWAHFDEGGSVSGLVRSLVSADRWPTGGCGPDSPLCAIPECLGQRQPGLCLSCSQTKRIPLEWRFDVPTSSCHGIPNR